MLLRMAERRQNSTAHLFSCLGVNSRGTFRHFLRLHRFHIQIQQELPHKITILRLRHVSAYGDLEVTTEGLAKICENNRESLEEITLNNCGKRSERLTQSIGGCEGLKVLNLANSRVEDQDIAILARTLGKLERLIIREAAGLSVHSSVSIGTMRNLRELDITGLEELPISPLSSLQLTTFLADNRSLSLPDLQSIAEMGTLQVISLRNCLGLGPVWHRRIAALPQLTTFIVSN